MRRVSSSRLWIVIALGLAGSPLAPSRALAGWPPPPDATAKEMADPANWPNDPGYAYSKDSDGQWNFYSFMPSVAHPRADEKIAGMSIDLAWRLSIGDPSVKIVITDSGIEWDQDDLIEKAWLNYNELAKHKPSHADGSACGGDGALAGFDCNGDHVLTVSDYKDTAALKPEATADHPKGDKNHNGKLDAGDLILNFSDGVDDDGNGYVDDISGWDFMKDDNDPYDDTRYGHGTGEAKDSTAATNNGIGDAGVCPLCRFIPARTGDSFITDITSFGKAVVYAADNDAKVVQCALGTINMNRFAQQALDYAYDKGVLVVTSMADENSRHHNMPSALNHTLPVHAIQYDGGSLQTATTFLAFHPCSNFGGQNLLSASGTSCSSEATGRLAGIAGLLYSAAIAYKMSPPLSPGEAQSIFFTTADDIDVPESRMPLASYRWSQKGFDQRFGYGRVNANRALEAIRDGKIPPVVDITSPTWFTVLYKDQVEGTVPIKGTISAKRANTFDYRVEWAPGVQPLEEEWKTITEEKGLSNTTVIGTNGPIASFDIRILDPRHARDVDSEAGENDTAITVRVSAVAKYGGATGDVSGEMRRTYYINSDPTLVKGFPIFLGDSGEANPKMADLDGDGVRELIYPTGGGVVHVYKLTDRGPVPLKGFPFKAEIEDGLVTPPPTPSTPVYLAAPAYAGKNVDPTIAREPFLNAPAIADLDGDGKPEIVLATFAGTLYVVGADGKLRAGWPRRLPLVPSCPLDPTAPAVTACMGPASRLARGAFASPVLADMDKDGKLDIIQAAFDGKIYALHADGSDVSGFPVDIHYTGALGGKEEPDRNRIVTTPAVQDMNGDGYPELLVGSNEHLGSDGQAGAIYLIDGRGKNAPNLTLPSWPQVLASFELFPLVAEGVPNAGVIGRFDGTLAAVMHGNGSIPLILPADPGAQTKIGETPPNAIPNRPDPYHEGKTLVGLEPASIFGPLSPAETPNTMLPLFAQPSLGDLDQDGVPDIVASGGSLNLAISLQGQAGGDLAHKAEHLLAMWSGKTGAMMPASPLVLEDYTFFNSQAIADLSGDDYPEVITGSGGYFLHAFDACGREPRGFPKFTGQWIIPTPAIGDLDGDKTLEVVVGTRDGWLYAWHTDGTTDSVIEWESFHHDNRNTGNLETPLEQGKKSKAKKPLTADMCSAPSTPLLPSSPSIKARGGCDCEAGGDPSAPAAMALLGLGLALAAARRRQTPR